MSIRSKQILLMLAIALVPVLLSGLQSYRQVSRMAANIADTAGAAEMERERHYLREKVADIGISLRLTGNLTQLLLHRQAAMLAEALNADRPATELPVVWSHTLDEPDTSRPSFLLADPDCGKPCSDSIQRLAAVTEPMNQVYRDAGTLSLWHYAGLANGVNVAFPGHGNYPDEYDPRDRPWYRAATASEGMTWLPLTIDASTGQPVLTATQALRDANGELLGATAIDLPLTRLLSFESEAVPWLNVAELAIVRRGEGDSLNIVAQQRALEMESDWRSAGQRQLLDGLSAEQVAAMSVLPMGDSLLFEHVIFRGNQHNLALTPITAGGDTWLVLLAPHSATEAAVAAAVAPVLEARADSLQQHLLGAALLAALVALVAVFAANRVTRPLISMSRTAGELADGRLDSRTGLKRSDEVGTLSDSIDRMADSIERLQLEQEQAYRDMIMALHRALEKKDSYTAGHSGRVTRTSLKLGRRIGLDDHTLEILRFGALTHDLGKIGIADAILNKPAPLVGDEIDIMRQHPSFSKAIMKPLVRFHEYAEIAGSHHEHWDGSGYPEGLKGEEIHLLARIVAIADAWDSMIGDRVYRKGMPVAKALEILDNERNSGQFDPELICEFIEMVRAEQAQHESAAAQQAH